jgi:hypothetical protein
MVWLLQGLPLASLHFASGWNLYSTKTLEYVLTRTALRLAESSVTIRYPSPMYLFSHFNCSHFLGSEWAAGGK